MATHCGILAWKILWTEEPGGLQSIGLQKVGHYLATNQQHEGLKAGRPLSRQARQLRHVLRLQ